MSTYAVLGAGRQGPAAAFDLATLGGAGHIALADADAAAAEARARGFRITEDVHPRG